MLYLFLRGMTGPDTPILDEDRCGVFAWPAAPGLVTRLSDALDAGARRVSTGIEPVDLADVRYAQSASGLMRAFNDAGVLVAADIQVALRLAALGGEEDESVRLAAALAVRAPRLGHVHVDLAEIRRSAAVETEDPEALANLPWPEPAGMGGARCGIGSRSRAEQPRRIASPRCAWRRRGSTSTATGLRNGPSPPTLWP